MPLYDDPDRRKAVDELLIEHGMLDGLQEFSVKLDPKTEATLRDMTRLQHEAYKNQDYELLARLNKDIKDLKLGRKEAPEFVVLKEKCDVEYETTEFEDMIAFGNQSANEVRQELIREQKK